VSTPENQQQPTTTTTTTQQQPTTTTQQQPAAGGQGGGGAPDHMIPKSRFDEVNTRMTNAEAAAAAARQEATERANEVRVTKTQNDLLRKGVDLDETSIGFALQTYDSQFKDTPPEQRPAVVSWMQSDKAPDVFRLPFQKQQQAPNTTTTTTTQQQPTTTTQQQPAPVQPPPAKVNTSTETPPSPAGPKPTARELYEAGRSGQIDRYVRKRS
jgi:hypothetical protein